MGIEIMEGYDANILPDADCYVIGNSISRGNPALEYLLSNQANLISGPEWLYKNILKDKKVIAVSGTHGKTTTTAMLAYIFEDQGIDAGYLIAGKPKDFPKSARKMIFPRRDEIEMENTGEMKNIPQHYLNKDGVIKGCLPVNK